MTVLESIVRGVQSLPLREQVEVSRYVHRLAVGANSERAAILHRTHGALDETDGAIFEQTMADRAAGILLDTSAVIENAAHETSH